jgi:cytoskeletal protein CcmA (bactofilin family)
VKAEKGVKMASVRQFPHLVVLSILLVLLGLDSAHALEVRGGDEVYVSEKINDDLFMGGTDGKFDGELRGDIIAAGMDITIDGLVDGNVNAAGYMVKVGGNVYRSVRMAGYKLTADGQIGNNLMMAGAFARVSSTCEVGNDVNISAGVVNINGTILGDLDVNADEVVISGTIDKNVSITCEDLTIDRSAVIIGDLVYSSPEKAKIADGAQIEGERKWKKKTTGDTSSFDSILKTLVLFVGAFVTGLLLFGCCRIPAQSVKGVIIADLPRAFGFGLVAFIVVPIILLFLLATVVGIPVSVVGLLIYMVLFYISKLFVATAIGDKVVQLVSSSKPKSYALSLFIGLVILTMLFNIPYLGWVFYLAAVVTGIGAVMIAFNRSRKAAKT